MCYLPFIYILYIAFVIAIFSLEFHCHHFDLFTGKTRIMHLSICKNWYFLRLFELNPIPNKINNNNNHQKFVRVNWMNESKKVCTELLSAKSNKHQKQWNM